VWGEANPRWLTTGKYSNEELKQILHDHIMEVVSHFKGKVAEWDVLNEPLEDDGSLRQTMWAKALGSEYPAIVFHWAHAADPEAKLFINEYGADGTTLKNGSPNPRAIGLAKLVTQLRKSGVPVDGVGLQMHDELNDFFTEKSIDANMKLFQSMGVETRVSEMDVNMDTDSAENEKNQAAIYRAALATCLINPKTCHSYSMWGFEDRYSSLQDNDAMYEPGEGLGIGMIFDKEGMPKPAYRALQQELAE
jgi:endo-1,4-beta-xylanase